MMRIKISCDSCDHEFSVSDELVGRRVKCPDCGEPVRVRDEDDDYEEERPRRSSKAAKSDGKSKGKKKKSGGNGLVIGLGIGGGVLILGLLGVVIFLLMSGSSDTPSVASTNPETPNVTNTATPPATTPTTPPMTDPAAMAAVPTDPATIAATPPTDPAAIATAPPATTPPPSTPPATNPPATTPPATNPPATTMPGTPVASNPSDNTPPKLSGVPEPSTEELKLPDLIKRVKPSVVRINVVSRQGASTGSGFVVSDDGTVVTNYHVVTDASRAEVEFADGTTAKVLGYRHLVPKADIAIIKIDLPKDQCKPVPISTSLPQEGETVAAFGAPHGLSFTTSDGNISAIRSKESIEQDMGLDLQGTWLQTTAPISPGNSGGPLVDMYGKVVGMNTMQLSIGQNLNFAVSALEINQALKEAPAQVKELKPEDLKPYQKNLSRKLATEEYDSDRGRRMFAEVKEIFLINMSKGSNFDPTDEIWNRVITRSKKAVEKSGIELSFGQPAPDAAVLMVYLEMKRSKRGTEGTQELVVRAELICFDPLAKKNVSPLAKVWKDEKTVGTVSLTAAASGVVPRSVDDSLAKFFSGFKGAYNKAVKANKETKPTASAEAAPAEEAAK